MQKIRQGDYFETPFLKKQKSERQVVCSLVSMYFDSPQLGIQYKQIAYNINKLYKTLDY